jgi:hypothetical protein
MENSEKDTEPTVVATQDSSKVKSEKHKSDKKEKNGKGR